MGEVKDRDGISAASSPAMMFCIIVAGDLNLQSRPVTFVTVGFDSVFHVSYCIA